VAERQEVRVPNIGDFKDVPVIEVMVKPGDTVDVDDALITLESDKAAMDVPATAAGEVEEVKVKAGDTLSEGDLILTLRASPAGDAGSEEADDRHDRRGETDEAGAGAEGHEGAAAVEEKEGSEEAEKAGGEEEKEKEEKEEAPERAEGEREEPRGKAREDKDKEKEKEKDKDKDKQKGEREAPERGRGAARPPPTAAMPPDEAPAGRKAHATPAVRRFARELGVDLGEITGTGRKGRILKEDVQRHVKARMSGQPPAAAAGLPEMPAIDFAKFGEVETRPLSRIKKLGATHLHRAWLLVPHVTQHDEADITELEAFRKAQGERASERGVRLTPLAFIMKAAVAALREFPSFNASLEPRGENLVLKHYYHLGIAVDTPEGLVVPVVRDVDKKGVETLARELAEVSERARARKLKRDELEGASFTISSLGGIGGTAFTPIVNAPEVAILGVSRAQMKPVYRDGELVPRLMLPLSLSYDHRVIDGAQAVRFTTHLAALLGDIRRLLL